MHDLASRLDRLLAQGENSALARKSARVRPEGLAREIVAFANGQGGVILLGVEDDGRLTGVDNGVKNYEEWVANVARNDVIPPIGLDIAGVEKAGRTILLIEVPKGRDKPYQTKDHQFLVRVGSTNRAATQGELLRLFQQSGVFHYDRVGVAGTSIHDINLARVDAYFADYQIDLRQEDNPERVLTNTDILDEAGQATVGGLLLFGINPQRHLPNACIAFAHFAGSEVTEELIDKQVIGGTLDLQVDTALAVLRNNLQRPSRIEGARTVDTRFHYPDKVFRELLVNACVHRNYAIDGSRIRVLLFDDRIEFISPGRLPNTVTVEKLKLGVSYAVNPVIVKFMENLRYIDRLGRGLPMVYRSAVSNGKRVVFDEIGEAFQVTLEL